MIVDLVAPLISAPGDAGRSLRHHAHGAIGDGVTLIAKARQLHRIARGIARAAIGEMGDQRPRARGLLIESRDARRRARAQQAREKIRHGEKPQVRRN